MYLLMIFNYKNKELARRRKTKQGLNWRRRAIEMEDKMDSFAGRHPVVILGYYVIALMLILLIGHPLLFALTAGMMFMYRFLQAGGRQSLRSLLYSIGTFLLCLIINPLFNHRGVTLVLRFGDMRITREAILYGGHMALLLLASLFLFACFSHVMTAEKIMTLTGKRLPSFSMLFTMILRTVPKVRHDFHSMTELHGNRPKVWSALLGVVMEDSVERSIAMKHKRYGKKERSHYFEIKLEAQDLLLMVCLSGMLGYFVWRIMTGTPSVRYFPSIHIDAISRWEWCLYLFYMGLPVWLWGKEECKWFLWKRKITGSIIRNKQSRPFL